MTELYYWYWLTNTPFIYAVSKVHSCAFYFMPVVFPLEDK